MRKAAARPLNTPGEFLRVFNDGFRFRFARATIVPTADEQQVGRVLEAVLLPPIQPWSHGYEFEADLAAAVAAEGCCAMFRSETMHHESNVVFYGDRPSITRLHAALSASS